MSILSKLTFLISNFYQCWAGIKNCIKYSWSTGRFIRVDNHGYLKIQIPNSDLWSWLSNFLKKVKWPPRKPPVLCRFFHKTRWMVVGEFLKWLESKVLWFWFISKYPHINTGFYFLSFTLQQNTNSKLDHVILNVSLFFGLLFQTNKHKPFYHVFPWSISLTFSPQKWSVFPVMHYWT